MNKKRAALGVGIAQIVITVLIITILLGFIIFSSGIRELDGVRGKLSVDNETKIGILDIYFYMDFYKKKVERRYKDSGGEIK